MNRVHAPFITGLPTKDETSERSLYRIYSVFFLRYLVLCNCKLFFYYRPFITGCLSKDEASESTVRALFGILP